MTPTFVIGIALVLGAAFLFYSGLIVVPSATPSVTKTIDRTQPLSIQIATAQNDKYDLAPKPERHWVTQPDLPSSAEIYGKLPRVPTRGIPETYQSMGIIKTDDGQLLPLYGRRTASRSDRFQYYTRTDTYNPVQLPINYNRRDCQDDIGCEELSNSDVVTITPTGQKGIATIYRFDGPTYVPGIL